MTFDCKYLLSCLLVDGIISLPLSLGIFTTYLICLMVKGMLHELPGPCVLESSFLEASSYIFKSLSSLGLAMWMPRLFKRKQKDSMKS